MIPNLEERCKKINECWLSWRFIEGLALVETFVEEGLPLDTMIGNLMLSDILDVYRKTAKAEARRAVSELRIRRVLFNEASNYTAKLGIFEPANIPDGTPAWHCFHDLSDEASFPWFLEKFPHALDHRSLPVIYDEDAIKVPGYYRVFLLD